MPSFLFFFFFYVGVCSIICVRRKTSRFFLSSRRFFWITADTSKKSESKSVGTNQVKQNLCKKRGKI